MTIKPIGELLEFKEGVDREGLHPMMWVWLGAVAVYHFELTNKPLTVTSARRPYREGVSSSHSPPPGELATAADIRRSELDRIGRTVAAEFSKAIQRNYGGHVGVVLEPEWLTVAQLEKRYGIRIVNREQEKAARRRVGPHIHFQLKGRLWSPVRSDET